ncbi:hypothetical protein TWF594_005670 [Orbilia oligospora]|nr:hypothetical protein TWF594_005670 [Orbilia oligospora]
MFATSRHIQEIIAQFELEGDTTLEIRAHEEDIRSYLDDQIKQSRRPILLKNCEVIKSEIARIVDGMSVLMTPSSTPVVCAERPLIKEELQFALAVKLEVDQPEIEKNNFTEVSDMISVCAGLVTIDEESNVVRLIHYTTQEYFNQAHKQWIYDAQGNIARVCPTYLSFETFDTGLIPASATLYRYAAQNWGHHTRKSLVKTTQSSVLNLLRSENIVSVCSMALMTGLHGDFDLFLAAEMTGMHLVAYFGLSEYIDQLLREGVDLEARDEWDRRPLSLAADEGHATVVELLLYAGADPEFESAMGLQTPLEYAVNREQGQTPLSQAAKIGCGEDEWYYVEKINNISTIMIKDFQPHPPPWFARWLSFSCPYYVPAMSQPHGLCLACVSRMVITIGMKLYKAKLIEGSPDN